MLQLTTFLKISFSFLFALLEKIKKMQIKFPMTVPINMLDTMFHSLPVFCLKLQVVEQFQNEPELTGQI